MTCSTCQNSGVFFRSMGDPDCKEVPVSFKPKANDLFGMQLTYLLLSGQATNSYGSLS